MEQELKNYKTATWILAAIVLVLGFWLIKIQTQDAETGLEAVTATIQKCSEDLGAWQKANPDPKLASAEAQAELSDILKECAVDTGEQPVDEGTLPQ